MLKFSFHMCGLEWWSFEEAVSHLAELGYDACGPIVGPGNHIDLETITDNRLAEMRRVIDDSGLAVALLNPWKVGGFTQMAVEGTAVSFYCKTLDVAAELGCPSVRFLTGSVSQGDRAGWVASINALREICHHGERVGVAMAMHNHENQMLDTVDKLKLMSSWMGSPALKVNLDPANFQCLGIDASWALRELRDDLAQIRLKGRIGQYPYTWEHFPGTPEDIVDWSRFFSTMKNLAYDGYAELVHYRYFPTDYPATALAWAKSMASEAGLI